MSRGSKKGMKRIKICSVCGQKFETSYAGGTITCPGCIGDRKKALERPYTRDTVFLVCKWYEEGMTVSALAMLLNRSQDNIRKALKLGGVEVK